MQQQKNFLLFIVLSSFIFLSWTALQNHLWPPPKRKAPSKQESPAFAVPRSELIAGVPALTQAWAEQLPASPGVGNACSLVAQLATADWSARVSRMWPAPAAPEKPIVKKPTEKIETFTLGDASTFNLQVLLTSRGGGVRQLILNKFQQANDLGLPVRDTPLHLIPDDASNPSFLLYHYADTKAANPLDTLGKLTWKPTGPTAIDNAGEDNETHKLSFDAQVEGQDVKITKTYSLRKGDYHLGLDIKVERLGSNDKAEPFRYQLTGGHGLPIEGKWYTYIFRNSLIGLIDNRGNVERDLQESRTIAIQEGGHDVPRRENKYIGYAGVGTQYFASMIVVDNKQPDGIDPSFLAWARPTVEEDDPTITRLRDKERQPQLADIAVRAVSQPLEVRPGKPITHRYLLYHGPIKVRLLGHLEGDKQVSPDLVHRYEDVLHLDTLTDYQSPGMFGTFFSAIGWTRVLILCTNMMHGLLQLLHQIVSNYGICIILLTVIVRGALFPLSRKQAIASAKMQEKMRELAPEVKKLEEKHRNDPMGLQAAKNELFMKRGVNPLAMMGSCWIIFLQMPIFMGLYYALQESIKLRLAPFLWIQNLAAPDMLWEWGNVPIVADWLGPFLNVLPIIAVTLMLVQQKMMMPPPTNEQEEMQQKMTKYMMVFMGFMFYKLPSGLCIYFIASSLWGLSERKLLPQKKPATATGGGGEQPPGRGKAGVPRPRSPKDDSNGNGGAMQKVRDWWAEVLEQAGKNPRRIERGKK